MITLIRTRLTTFLRFYFHRRPRAVELLLRADHRRRDALQHVQNWFRASQVSAAIERYVCTAPNWLLSLSALDAEKRLARAIKSAEKNQSISNKQAKGIFFIAQKHIVGFLIKKNWLRSWARVSLWCLVSSIPAPLDAYRHGDFYSLHIFFYRNPSSRPVRVHLQPGTRRVQESRFKDKKLHRRHSNDAQLSSLSGCWRHREHR